QRERRGSPRLQRLAGPDREPDSDQVDGAQRDGDRKPNRRFEGHGVILSTIWNRSTYTTRPTSAMFQQSTWPRTRAPDSYLWRRIPPDGVYERTRPDAPWLRNTGGCKRAAAGVGTSRARGDTPDRRLCRRASGRPGVRVRRAAGALWRGGARRADHRSHAWGVQHLRPGPGVRGQD